MLLKWRSPMSYVLSEQVETMSRRDFVVGKRVLTRSFQSPNTGDAISVTWNLASRTSGGSMLLLKQMSSKNKTALKKVTVIRRIASVDLSSNLSSSSVKTQRSGARYCQQTLAYIYIKLTSYCESVTRTSSRFAASVLSRKMPSIKFSTFQTLTAPSH